MAQPDPQMVIEGALLVAGRPLTIKQLQTLFEPELEELEVEQILVDLQEFWRTRAVNLVQVVEGWRFQSAPVLREPLYRLNKEVPPKYAPSILQTLAVIAWRQPVTRGDIEEIRGGAPHPDTYKRLLERGWIEVVGHRETVGRPELLGTTRQFLSDLGLKSLADLPIIEDEVLRQEEFALSNKEAEPELPLEIREQDPDSTLELPLENH